MFDIKNLPEYFQDVYISYNGKKLQKYIQDLWLIAEKFDELDKSGQLIVRGYCADCGADIINRELHNVGCKIVRAQDAIRRLMYNE